MAKSRDQDEMIIEVPELARLLPPERRLALRVYRIRLNRFDKLRPTEPTDNRLRALNLAFVGAAYFWLVLAVPAGLLEAWVFAPGVHSALREGVLGAILAVALSLIALVGLIMAGVRMVRSWKIYPRLVRIRPTWRHPHMFT